MYIIKRERRRCLMVVELPNCVVLINRIFKLCSEWPDCTTVLSHIHRPSPSSHVLIFYEGTLVPEKQIYSFTFERFRLLISYLAPHKKPNKKNKTTRQSWRYIVSGRTFQHPTSFNKPSLLQMEGQGRSSPPLPSTVSRWLTT